MSWISKKENLFRGWWGDEKRVLDVDTSRMMTYNSTTDPRSWALDDEQRRQYFLDLMNYAPTETREELLRKIRRLENLLACYQKLKLTDEQKIALDYMLKFLKLVIDGESGDFDNSSFRTPGSFNPHDDRTFTVNVEELRSYSRAGPVENQRLEVVVDEREVLPPASTPRPERATEPFQNLFGDLSHVAYDHITDDMVSSLPQEQLRTIMVDMSEKINALNNELKDKLEKEDDLVRKLRQQSQDIANYETKLEEIKQKVQEEDEEKSVQDDYSKDQLQFEFEMMTEENKKLKDTIAQLETDLEQMRKKLFKYDLDYPDVLRRSREFQQENETLKQRQDELQETLKKTQRESMSRQEQATNAEKQLEDVKQANETLAKEFVRFKDAMTMVKNVKDCLCNKLEAEEKTRKQLEAKYGELQEICRCQKSAIDVLTNKCECLATALDRQNNVTRHLSQQLETVAIIKSKCEFYKCQCQKLLLERESLHKETTSSSCQCSDATEEELKRENCQLEARVRQKEQELNGIGGEMELVNNHVQMLVEQCEKQRIQKQEARRLIDRFQETIREQEERLRTYGDLSGRYESSKQNLNEKDEEIEELRVKINELERQLEGCTCRQKHLKEMTSEEGGKVVMRVKMLEERAVELDMIEKQLRKEIEELQLAQRRILEKNDDDKQPEIKVYEETIGRLTEENEAVKSDLKKCQEIGEGKMLKGDIDEEQQERKIYEETVRLLTEENELLKDQLRKCRENGEAEGTEDNLGDLTKEFENVQQRLNECKEVNQQLEEQIKGNREREKEKEKDSEDAGEMKNQSFEKAMDVKELEEKLNSLTEELGHSQQQLKESEELNQQLEEQLKEIKGYQQGKVGTSEDAGEIKNQSSEKAVEVKELEEKLNTLTEELENCQKQLKESQELNQQLEEQLKEIKGYQQGKVGTSEDAGEVKNQSSEKAVEVKELEEKLNILTEKLENCQKQLKESQELNQQLEEQLKEIKEYQKEKVSRSEDAEEIKNQSSEKAMEFKELEEKLNDLTKELENCQKQWKNSEELNQQLEEELKEIKEYQKEKVSRSEDAGQIKNQSSEKAMEFKELEEKLNDLTKQLENAQQQLKKSEESNQLLEEQLKTIDELQKAGATENEVNQTAFEKAKELKEMKEKINDLTNELENAQQQLKECRESNRHLDEQIKASEEQQKHVSEMEIQNQSFEENKEPEKPEDDATKSQTFQSQLQLLQENLKTNEVQYQKSKENLIANHILELQKLKQTNKDLIDQQRQCESEKTDLRAQLTVASQQMLIYEARIRELENEIRAVREQVVANVPKLETIPEVDDGKVESIGSLTSGQPSGDQLTNTEMNDRKSSKESVDALSGAFIPLATIERIASEITERFESQSGIKGRVIEEKSDDKREPVQDKPPMKVKPVNVQPSKVKEQPTKPRVVKEVNKLAKAKVDKPEEKEDEPLAKLRTRREVNKLTKIDKPREKEVVKPKRTQTTPVKPKLKPTVPIETILTAPDTDPKTIRKLSKENARKMSDLLAKISQAEVPTASYERPKSTKTTAANSLTRGSSFDASIKTIPESGGSIRSIRTVRSYDGNKRQRRSQSSETRSKVHVCLCETNKPMEGCMCAVPERSQPIRKNANVSPSVQEILAKITGQGFEALSIDEFNRLSSRICKAAKGIRHKRPALVPASIPSPDRNLLIQLRNCMEKSARMSENLQRRSQDRRRSHERETALEWVRGIGTFTTSGNLVGDAKPISKVECLRRPNDSEGIRLCTCAGSFETGTVCYYCSSSR